MKVPPMRWPWNLEGSVYRLEVKPQVTAMRFTMFNENRPWRYRLYRDGAQARTGGGPFQWVAYIKGFFVQWVDAFTQRRLRRAEARVAKAEGRS